MGRIRLTGATSGYTELRAANAAGNNTITLPTTSGGEVIVSDSSGNVNIDGGTLYVDATNNRVGIGTSSPGSNLDVRGSSTGTLNLQGGSAYAQLTLTDGGSGVNYIDSTNANLSIRTNNSSWLRLGTNNTTAVHIDSSQRVGIGTTSPATALDVQVSGGRLQVYPAVNATGTRILSVNTANTTAVPIEISGTQVLFTNSANTPVGQFDASGRLLIGTSSAPTVGASANARAVIQGNSADSASSFVLSLQRGEAPSTITSGEYIGQIMFAASDGSPFAEIAAVADANAGTNDYPGRLMFSTTADGASSPTERMRIANTGKNSTYSTSDSFDIRTSLAAGTGSYLIYATHSATGVGTGGTNSLAIYTNGNIQNTNGSYTTLSDAKLKENIVDAGSQWNDLKAIQIRNWNFKAETGHETHRQIGPIAQELETVCPGLVFEIPDRDADGNETGEVTKGVNQSVLYMKAVKALQEAMERIETLEAKVAALESA